MRYSKQKELIKNILKGHKDHPTADVIYHETRKVIPNISLGTVYRNLDRLAFKGEIIKIDCPSGGKRFDPDTGNHYHFFCLKCGKVEDVPLESYLPKKEEISGWIGKRLLKSVDFSFKGLCEDCAAVGE